jgi:DNA-binding response OmpR family regulator
MISTVLLADDDKDIVQSLSAYLQESGFKVITANEGLDTLNKFHTELPDIVLLDIMMPNINGLDVLRKLRETATTPIILLTARDDEADTVVGLELGADDYVTKPFSPRELVARIRASIRRNQQPKGQEEILVFSDIHMDLKMHTAMRKDITLDLTRTEFDLLRVLMENPLWVLSRSQLIESALGYSFEGFERTIDAHIRNLRKKLELDPKNPTYITTVFGIGYRLQDPAVN